MEWVYWILFFMLGIIFTNQEKRIKKLEKDICEQKQEQKAQALEVRELQNFERLTKETLKRIRRLTQGR